jgi:hypothetical protein
MDRIYLNQTALSLGYIALKRIRAIESAGPRLPSRPLLRHLGHIKILAACVDQVGPEEIIEYEMNQDFAGGEVNNSYDAHDHPRRGGAHLADDDVAPERSPPRAIKPLDVIAEETDNDQEPLNAGSIPPAAPQLVQRISTAEEDEEYSMDELYDQYNSQDDGWETASDVSDDDISCVVDLTSSKRQKIPISRKSQRVEVDSDEEDVPATPPSVLISRSPPLDITLRHPITYELNKREQYRRELDSLDGNDLSRAFVEQIEDVIAHEMRYLSLRGGPSEMRLPSRPRQVSLYA